MTEPKLKSLGASKYDANIRRITLLKNVADIMGMEDGDRIVYFQDEDTGEIIIRKATVMSGERIPIPDFVSEDVSKALQEIIDVLSKELNKNKNNGIIVPLSKDQMVTILKNSAGHLSAEEMIELQKGMEEFVKTLDKRIDLEKGRKS